MTTERDLLRSSATGPAFAGTIGIVLLEGDISGDGRRVKTRFGNSTMPWAQGVRINGPVWLGEKVLVCACARGQFGYKLIDVKQVPGDQPSPLNLQYWIICGKSRRQLHHLPTGSALQPTSGPDSGKLLSHSPHFRPSRLWQIV